MSNHSTTDRLATALAYCDILKEDRQRKDAIKAQDKARLKQEQPKKQVQSLQDHVYVVKASNGCYKIGISFRPRERIKRLRQEVAAWAVKLELVHVITPNHAYGLEQSLHRHFAAQRVTGEWFLLTDQDVEWLQSL